MRVVEQIIHIVPSFQETWHALKRDWNKQDLTLGIALAEFVSFYTQNCGSISHERKMKLFALIEEIVLKGDETDSTAVCHKFSRRPAKY